MKFFVHSFPHFAHQALLLTLVMLQHSVFAAKDVEPFSHFIGVERFSNYQKEQHTNDSEVVLTSPVYTVPINWNELVVSWNVHAPTGSMLKIEARGIYPDKATRFYNLGIWSPDSSRTERQSIKGQKDEDGNVLADTLVLNRSGAKAEIRITLTSGEQGKVPELKFVGISFCDSSAVPQPPSSARTSWGKELDVIGRSQNAYPDEKGWCSPTSISMVLNHWSKKLNRPELDLDVPQLVPAIFDKGWEGTGNWPFNTAVVGSFEGMRAYVTRFAGVSELEQWIGAGYPVIISSPWDLLEEGRKKTGNGHIVVVRGFTKEGDVVINDPGTDPTKDSRRVYKRQNVINAWSKSNNTVYLIYPEKAKIPKDLLSHWEK